MNLDNVLWAGAAAQAELSARELIEATLERIARLDGTLNAFHVAFSDQARAEVDQADGRRHRGDTPPPLGVPVAVKDDTGVGGEVTAWGCAARTRSPRRLVRAHRLWAAGPHGA